MFLNRQEPFSKSARDYMNTFCSRLDEFWTKRRYLYKIVLITLYEYWTINVDSRVLTVKNYPPPLRLSFSIDLNHFRAQLRYYLLNKVTSRVLTRFYFNSNVKKSATPLGGYVFP
ncbi:hypothetical protein DPMN_017255 [Dreissena polymorpha]|uniref:Uncharacterized protein n=1 Tax=Dreissena polymorpha TaxID=45954 RepID=A0A9D4NF04_DREPO|nr:hypothetical protein DPMN_017255 [Dreissena polymorpha]